MLIKTKGYWLAKINNVQQTIGSVGWGGGGIKHLKLNEVYIGTTVQCSFHIIYGRSRNKPKTKIAPKSSWGDLAGKHTCFPCVTYFFISSLVKYGKYECFSLKHP